MDNQLILKAIDDHWHWAIGQAEDVHAISPMGNVIVRDALGQFWRLCPEELSVKLEAQSESAIDRLMNSKEYTADWQLNKLISAARLILGDPLPGQCYAMIEPCAMGGEYDVSNMLLADLSDYLAFAGDCAEQVDGMEDGAEVELCIYQPESD